MLIPTSQLHSVWPALEAVILTSVLVSQALCGEEIKGFHMMYCGPYSDNLSTFTLLKQIAQIPQNLLLARVKELYDGDAIGDANSIEQVNSMSG